MRYWADDSEGYLKFRLDSCLHNYVSGLQFQVEITDAQGFIYSNISDTVNKNDVFQLPTSSETKILQLNFTQYGDYFDFLIKIVGIPQIAGEEYYSDITVAMTLALARNILTIFPKSNSIQVVQPATKMDSITELIEKDFFFLNNFPNPFNPNTTIQYQLSKASHINITLFDIRGRVVSVLQDKNQQPGYYTLQWDGTDELGNSVPSSTYFCRMSTNEFTQTRKLLLIR